MAKPVLEPLATYHAYPETEMIARARSFYEDLRRRRTVRDFSNQPIPIEVIEQAILAAGTAPSGANLQPWHFAVITSPEVKQRIRANTTPRHVPAKILQVADIPRTKSGKIVELAVRDVVHGRPVRNVEALANPEALEHFRNLPALSAA